MIVQERMQTVHSDHLAAIYRQIKDNGDRANAVKIVDIFEKMEKQELIISFAGHFSAGKSSMINTLLGKEILPKSPIPTSANVVKINSGEGVARVYFTSEQPVEYKEPYDIDMIKEYSKDKEAIKKIEISTGEQIIPVGCAIIDTPGIDAADDADRIMTEASLHLADVLLYIMDYNHVQSEVNLQFLKSIQEKRLPYYVVINQIDKHDERELTFEAFQNNIKQTFDQWDLKPEDIYYSSLVDASAAHNQIDKIKQKLSVIMGNREQFFNTVESVNQVMEDHKYFLQNTYETMKRDLFHDQGQITFSDPSELEMTKKLVSRLENEPIQFENDYMGELQQTLNNAYLMPASLRDKAKLYLESQQPDFKIGLFASRKKTMEEKNTRAYDFLSALTENIHASIQWKLRDKLNILLKKYVVNDSALQSKVNELQITYDLEHVEKLIKPGAKMNGDYVLNYTNDVSADVKSKFKQNARTILNLVKESIKKRNKADKDKYLHRVAELKKERDVEKELIRIEDEEKQAYEQLDSQLIDPKVDASLLELIRNELKNKPRPVRLESKPLEHTVFSKQQEQITKQPELKRSNQTSSANSVLKSIDLTINLIKELPGFESLLNDLKQKEYRLKNRSYTIALFGAFSAGKSSFANALMGEKVLPVSPNPTTATVNRIRPVDEENRHGSVVVTLKSEASLFNDLRMITKKLEPKAITFNEMMEWLQSNRIDKHDKLNKMFQSYLHAMIAGYGEMKRYIGNRITITLEEFENYVTDEKKACYFESIDLYYDSELTRQGITLVDTPGADSVNARHTNVAFDYIKHADAILYVTYYNHALSRADKDFLMQLGRVKEAFQLDKMFFIVNAADLAQDEAELKLVTDYVQEQLQQLGIRLPRLYPVSSKSSLAEKIQKKPINSQMHRLESDFYQFIHHDLAALTIDSAIWDMKRTRHAVDNYIQSMTMDNDEKQHRKQDLSAKIERLSQEINTISTDGHKEQIIQKVEKQLFYVMERLSIRYHDMFKEMFNPTTITEPGRKGHMQLRTSLDNLLEYIGYELHQELQAVSLRVEASIQSQLKEVHQILAEKSTKTDQLFEMPEMDPVKMETPDYRQGLDSADLNEFDRILSKYKGTKAFFEKNEKEFMKEEMYAIIETYAKQYVHVNKSIMLHAYMEQWDEHVDQLIKQVEQNIDLQMNNYLEVLVSTVDLSLLMQKQEQLGDIIKQYDIEEVY
ncbi:dynamin family protein [Oceanobacillus saliphilus]|uniref:dynamin family protein n=1 Tax=Oceanobacillus saliphilus TaxID=2925834 RepID=UPI00201D90FA|nr:dynamin family protein [Oceanobacillus saliphilus]